MAQRDTSPYKPFAMFNGDTVSYLEFNYTIRGNQYKGWTVGEILKEIELPVLYLGYPRMLISMDNTPTKLTGLGLGIKQTGKNPNELYDYYIYVCFENPPDLSEFRGISRTLTLTPKLYDFIKDLKVLWIGFNEFIIKDPELIEKAKREREEVERRGREAQEKLERRRRNRQQ
ncbi:MAG: hypothetical protein LBC98_04170 [Prevotellaceae bacterium]|jgi:hypothetical protein|nr:hypothetical protein [Prevotellaceae bacterium]